jgi:hypothetical protein
MRRSWTLALVVLPVVAACGGGRAPEAAVPAGGTVPAITPADLKLRSAIFADDSMLGRRAGTVGNVRGNAYIAGELARLGLKPAGDSGGFLQRVPLTSYALDTARRERAGRVLGLLPLPADVRGAGPTDQRRPARLRGHAGGLGRVAHARGAAG